MIEEASHSGDAAYPHGQDQLVFRSNGGRRPEQQIGMMEEPSDEALMSEVSARRQQAFRILMRRHMPRALRVAERILRIRPRPTTSARRRS